MPSATFTGEERGEDEGPHSDGVVAVATEEDSNSCVASAVGEDDGVSGGDGDGGGCKKDVTLSSSVIVEVSAVVMVRAATGGCS